MPIVVVLDAYGNDSGPAHLQNTDINVETFKGWTNMNDSNNYNTKNSFMEVDAVQTVVNQLH